MVVTDMNTVMHKMLFMTLAYMYLWEIIDAFQNAAGRDQTFDVGFVWTLLLLSEIFPTLMMIISFEFCALV